MYALNRYEREVPPGDVLIYHASIGDPDVSEAVYRLLKASREGRRLQEEVRVAGLNGKEARWLRMRVRPLEDGKKSKATVWSIADVTRDREKGVLAKMRTGRWKLASRWTDDEWTCLCLARA